MDSRTPKTSRDDQCTAAGHKAPSMPWNKIGTPDIDKSNILKSLDGSRPRRSTSRTAAKDQIITPTRSGLLNNDERPNSTRKRPAQFDSDAEEGQCFPEKKQVVEEASHQNARIPIGTHIHANGLPIYARLTADTQSIFLFVQIDPKTRTNIIKH
ncbi:hypothetical protein BGZ60DRAFT_165661 [Tricladium varicosporioides]|nr:hypothetical protein BGZ60DRAFT_165661 [Hymenoscyphus varicosporioides]